MTQRIESNILRAVDIGEERFELVQYRDREAKSNQWHYGLIAYQPNLAKDGHEEGVDVDELDEDTAIQILGELFNIHITDEKGVCRF